jgi:hypothetical protein
MKEQVNLVGIRNIRDRIFAITIGNQKTGWSELVL